MKKCRVTLVAWILLGMLMMTCHAAWHPGKGINYLTWPLRVKSRSDEQTVLKEMAQRNETAQATVDTAQLTPVQTPINNKIEQRVENNIVNPEVFLRESVTILTRKNQEPLGTLRYPIAGPRFLTLPQRRLFKRDVTSEAGHTPNIVNTGASDFRERLISLGLLKPLTQPLNPLNTPVGLGAAKTAAALELGKAAAGVDLTKKGVGLGLLKKAVAAPVVLPANAAGIGLAKLAVPKVFPLGGLKKVAETAAVTAVDSKGIALAPFKAATIFGGAKALQAKSNVAEIGGGKPLALLPLKGLGLPKATETVEEVVTPKPAFGADWREKIKELGLFPNLIKPIGLGRAATEAKTESVTTDAKDLMQAAASNIVPVKVVAPKREPSGDLEAAATIAFENIDGAGLENSTPLNMQDDMEEMIPKVGNSEEQTTTQMFSIQTEKTPEILDFEMCMNKKCVLSKKYEPVCGTDGIVYQNLGHLLCAQLCGKDVHFSAMKPPSCNDAESTT